MTPREIAIAAIAALFALLWLHAEWRRHALGSMSRAALKELKRLQPKH